MSGDPGEPLSRLAGRLALAFAGLMHAAVGGFVLASGQLLPAAVALALGAAWVLVAALIVRWRHRRPLIVLLLPFAVPVGLWAALARLAE